MIKAYKDYWRGYADFSGRTSVSGYWWFVLANFIVTFILSFIQSLLLTFGGDQTVVSYLIAFQFINILPSIAIVVRRLRDAGLSWANIFWMFLPLAGPIILIVKLCKPSVPPAYLNIRQKSPPELGPGYIAAGVLLLWFAFEDFAHAAFAGVLAGRNIFWWLSLLSTLALAVLLFIGKKNFGLLIPAGIKLLLSVKWLFPKPGISGLLNLAAWISVCTLMVITIFKLSQDKTLLSVLTYLPAGLFFANNIFVYILNLTSYTADGGYILLVTLNFLVSLLWDLAFLFLARSLTLPPVETSPISRPVYPPAYGVQPLPASPYSLPLAPPQHQPPGSFQNVQSSGFQQAGQVTPQANTTCNHEWISLKNSWSERCVQCGKVEPAKFRQHATGLTFPMACIPDSDFDIILTALQMKSMIRSSIDEVQNEFRTLNDKLRINREYMLSKDEWNSVFLSLSTYGSTSPSECPPIFAAMLIADKQQRVKSFLFDRWMSMM